MGLFVRQTLGKKRMLTLEQLSHLNIVPLFLPVLVTLIPAPLISVFVGGVAEASSGTVFSSAASCFGIIVASPDAIWPLAAVKDVAVWGAPGGGGEPERESVAKEERAAAAVWSITGLRRIYIGSCKTFKKCRQRTKDGSSPPVHHSTCVLSGR